MGGPLTWRVLLAPVWKDVADPIERVRDGDDAYLVLTEVKGHDGWKQAWSARMQRQKRSETAGSTRATSGYWTMKVILRSLIERRT